MSKETKVGLLVGLAFVILFGIILSEKDSNVNYTPPNITSYKPIVEVLPPEEPKEVPSITKQEGPIVDKVKILATDVKLNNKQELDPLNASNQVQNEEDSKGIEKRNLPEKELSPAFKELIEDRSDNIVASSYPASPEKDTKHNTEVINDKERFSRYTTYLVKPGDTLIKICKEFYPEYPHKMVKQIMQLNNIKRPELLLAGQTIKLPLVAEEARKQSSYKDGAAVQKGLEESNLFVKVNQPLLRAEENISPTPFKKSDTEKSEDLFFQYVVKENDNLCKIAERFYGNQNLWKKIYEINKSILPDPNKIRSGIKIKIPILQEGLADKNR